jgi:hypothetical protein
MRPKVRAARIRLRLFSSEVLDEQTQVGLGADFLDQLGTGRNPLFDGNQRARWFSDPGSNLVEAVIDDGSLALSRKES